MSGQMEIQAQSPSSYLLEKTTSGPSYLQSGGTTKRTANKEI